MVSPRDRGSDDDMVAGLASSRPAPAATTVAPDLGSTHHTGRSRTRVPVDAAVSAAWSHRDRPSHPVSLHRLDALSTGETRLALSALGGEGS